jgi:hypothetical protein
MRAVALVCCLALLGCFPGNKKAQRYAKLTEGGMLLGGIVILAVANTGADCDSGMGGLGGLKNDCKQSASLVSAIGLGLVVAGLVGFAATITTAGDDDKPTTTTKTITPTPTPDPTPTPTPTASPAATPN